CRRESKDCFFSATRRKRKADEGAEDSYDFGDDYIIRNGRKMVGIGRQASLDPISSSRRTMSLNGDDDIPPAPLTPGGSIGRREPLRRPGQSTEESPSRNERGSEESNTQLENLEAQEVMRREVYGPHDALDLLYKAATDSNTAIKRTKRDSNHQLSPVIGDLTPSDRQQPILSRANSQNDQNLKTRTNGHRDESAIDPALASAGININRPDRTQDQGYKDAVRAWSRFRFVRAGWFTAPEAIDYIDYYYEYLSPLTPISPPTFQNPGTHPTLLTEEPILTVTLLTISSRYKKLSGTGGSCRSSAIHEQLWTYLRGMIERCLWGQEAFGGGFCGSGADPEAQTSSTAPWRGLRKGSLRTLGTIESFMILTEWHPRALHFPPQDATDELMLPLYDGND
ncbi:hypothetical protein DH86_00001078, partial [Scytalidium sp. 3C]